MNTLSRKATAQRKAAGRRRTRLLMAAGGFVVVAAVVAFVLAGQGGDDAPEVGEQFGEVAVDGQGLPPLGGAAVADDPAVGAEAPALEGADFGGDAVAVPADGEPTLLVFAAHWCPHCQAEIPRIVDWMAAGGGQDVSVVAVSTAADSKNPNWPPQTWLEREEWNAPVLVDDESNSAGAAYGVDGYPFFALVADGTVVWRASGEIGIDALEAAIAEHAG